MTNDELKVELKRNFNPSYDLVDTMKYYKPKLVVTTEDNFNRIIKAYEDEIKKLREQINLQPVDTDPNMG